MSSFQVKVHKIQVEPHPDPEVTALECARIGDFRVVVGKGQFVNNSLAVYIPQDSILPDDLITEMGLDGKLAGPDKNRVKAIRLRGQLSQGLCYQPADEPLTEGDDWAEKLGITKYQPPIPVEMSGITEEAWGKTLKFDIENFKHYPDLIQPNQNVVITEKIHGTWCCIGLFKGEAVVCSKGLSNKGLRMKVDEGNKGNIYVKQFLQDEEKLKKLLKCFDEFMDTQDSVYVLGEIYGKKIQDMEYGLETRDFRVFDIWIGTPADGHFLDWDMLKKYADKVGFTVVPELHQGKFNKEKVYELANSDKSTIADHLMEGVVVRAFMEEKDDQIGRMVLKCTGEAYELRKKGTERQ